VEEIISEKRFELVDYIETQLSEKLAENGLSLVDFVLRNITFSPEYAASVEQKQIAEQQVEQQKFVVEQKKQEALQAVELARGESEARIIAAEGAAQARMIEAQAEADALELLSGILQDNPDLLTYQYINKLAPTINTMLLPNENPFIFQLPETP
jgi:regulator of protease activity HflC (stomatin/prohibitin superfamily)